jgi:hypothetical protein
VDLFEEFGRKKKTFMKTCYIKLLIVLCQYVILWLCLRCWPHAHKVMRSNISKRPYVNLHKFSIIYMVMSKGDLYMVL